MLFFNSGEFSTIISPKKVFATLTVAHSGTNLTSMDLFFSDFHFLDRITGQLLGNRTEAQSFGLESWLRLFLSSCENPGEFLTLPEP